MLAIQSYVEINQIQKAREELEQARKIGVESRVTRIAELTILGCEKNWAEATSKAEQWISGCNGPIARASLDVWGAVPWCTRGDIARAEAYSSEAVNVMPWDQATQVARALVLAVQNRWEEARELLVKAEVKHLNRTAQAAGAHLWAEIYRRKGDAERQGEMGGAGDGD